MSNKSINKTLCHYYGEGLPAIVAVNLATADFRAPLTITIAGEDYTYGTDFWVSDIFRSDSAALALADAINAIPGVLGTSHNKLVPHPLCYATALGTTLVLYGRLPETPIPVSSADAGVVVTPVQEPTAPIGAPQDFATGAITLDVVAGDFVQGPNLACRRLVLMNDSGGTISLRRESTTESPVRIPDGTAFPIRGITNADQIELAGDESAAGETVTFYAEI